MRSKTAALTGLILILASLQTAGAEQQPSPQPSPPVAAAVRLSDQEIRDLLVGNKYFAPGRDGVVFEVELRADGTLFGRISDRGHVPVGSANVSRNQDDGKYVIKDGRLCLSYSGAWANGGKPNCHTVSKGDKGYYFGTTPIDVVQTKK
ncbi:MAG TPA: hypothetical protein VGD01_07435 [Candidatus Elarobacter sp.]|jgi:hypothetical protein